MFAHPFLLAFSSAFFLLPIVEGGPACRALSTSGKAQSTTSTILASYPTASASKPSSSTTSITRTAKTTEPITTTKSSTKLSIRSTTASTATTTFTPNPSCGTSLQKFVLRAAAGEEGVTGQYLFNDDSTGQTKLAFNTTSIRKAQQFSFGPNCTIVNGPDVLHIYYNEWMFKIDPTQQWFGVPNYSNDFSKPFLDQCSVNAANELSCKVRDSAYFATTERGLFISESPYTYRRVTVVLEPVLGLP